MKTVITLFAMLVVFSSLAQEKKYDISKPLDLPQAGWNKVLCMKNGNTLLFHFEPMKNILVKVFDANHREIASHKDPHRIIDVLLMEYVVFKGLYEINGEAVLFVDQERLAKHGLIRLRYNASTGRLIEEKLVAESQSANTRMRFYVMKERDTDNYEIFFCTDKHHPVKSCDLFVVYFNGKHQSMKEVQLEVDRKKYDYLQVLGAESQENGILISVGLDKTIQYARPDHEVPLLEGGSVYDHHVAYFFLPKNKAGTKNCVIDVSESVYPYFTLYAYNPFARSLNSMLFSYKPINFQFGLNLVTGSVNSDHFFKLSDADMAVTFNRVKNKKAIDYLQAHTDTAAYFDGIPLKMTTNQNGLTTMISQSETMNGEEETSIRYNFEQYIGNIGITQLDDDGNEIWGTILPFHQYFKSYNTFNSIKALPRKWQDLVIFGDKPVQVYNRQFLSVDVYNYNNDQYIIYNDYDKNFSNTLKKPGDTVYSFNNTNACYYKLDSKREVTKKYLFGQGLRNESRSCFIEGADFDEKSGVFVSLVQYRRNSSTSLRMAWCHLD